MPTTTAIATIVKILIYTSLFNICVNTLDFNLSNIENAINANPTTKVPPMAYFEL